MGAVNYFTSDYITMGLRPYDLWELENGIRPKLPHDIPKRQKLGVSCSCEEVQKMGFLFLLVFPFVLLAEILKRN